MYPENLSKGASIAQPFYFQKTTNENLIVMYKWELAINRIRIKDERDRTSFLEALHRMNGHPGMKTLLQAQSIPALYQLFQQLQADQNPFSLIFAYDQEGLLHDFLQRILRGGESFPHGRIAQKTFIELCSLAIEKEALQDLLAAKMLDFLSVDQLQRLVEIPSSNLRVLIRFFKDNYGVLPDDLMRLGTELIMLAPPAFVAQKRNIFLREFLSAILPRFEARFAHRMDRETLFRYPGKILAWWEVWHRHQERKEETSKEDEYYQTNFSTIIQYVPEYIWWNNGLSYGRNSRGYHFQSPEFRHLAVGGSVRKGPDFRPYTRRMAKAFVTLPYNFHAGMRDMYLYFYGISLGAGELLLTMMQRFVRHRSNRIQLLAELELWNPVLQKLACADFENLDIPDARSLMGYLYHCLRDQPDYQVKSRTIAQLNRDSQVYLDRIQARANARAAREQARLLMTGKKSQLIRWAAHPSVGPMELKQADRHYKIVELTDENQLNREGAVMNHCVGGYTYKCTDTTSSIWSLREYINGSWFSLVTIELEERRVVQARGPFNATPTPEQRKLIRAWKRRENID